MKQFWQFWRKHGPFIGDCLFAAVLAIGFGLLAAHLNSLP